MEQKNYSYLAISLTIGALLFTWLAWHQTKGIASNEDTLARVQATGKISACTVVDPPDVIKDPKTGTLSGHFIDTAELIAQRLGATIEWHESTWGTVAADLNAKRCDLVAATLFANIKKAAAVAFTQPPLFYIGESALVKRNGPFAPVKNMFEFDTPTTTIAVATGESGDIFVSENFKQAVVHRIDVESSDLSRFAVEVSSGRADVAISDANTVRLYAEQHPEVIDLFKGQPVGRNPVAWATRPDDRRWREFIETSLQFLDQQGFLSILEQKYGAHWLHEVKNYKVQ